MELRDKKYIYLISSMRSGSTLLKALIASRPDATDLPETSFNAAYKVATDKPLIVVKKPAWYDNYDYPRPFSPMSKKIILIRNPYDTIMSLYRMNEEVGQKILNTDLFLISYWKMVYSNILTQGLLRQEDILVVRYEELISEPVKVSETVFKFIGTKYPQGTNEYYPPSGYTWKWGKDDGGECIKTLKVIDKIPHRTNDRLIKLIKNDSEIKNLLSYFGYTKAYY